MRILVIGDVTARAGKNFLCQNINDIIKEKSIDFCVVNAENIADTNGITESDAVDIFKTKVDVITLGNHAFSNPAAYKVFKTFDSVIRPVNYPKGTPGRSFFIKKVCDINVTVVNALGRVFMHNLVDCPFAALDKLLSKVEKFSDIVILDFHAEATSEKIALANYFDGRIDIIFGTHTHVQTADEQILPNGTAYITDVGMTGVIDSILGVKKNIIIQNFITARHHKYEKAEGEVLICGAIFEFCEETRKTLSIERLKFPKCT